MTKFPLNQWQHYVLKRELHPDVSELFLSHLTLSATLRVRPGLAERRLNRAFKTLCKRHDITRIQFLDSGTALNCTINDAHMLGVTYHDYRDVGEDQVGALAVQHTRKRIGVKDTALVCLDVLKFGSLGDVIVFRAHHIVTDGFGFMLMLEDLIKSVIGMPLLPGAVRYAEYYAKYGRDIPEEAAAHDDYWKTKLFPPAAPLNIGRVKRELPFMHDGITWNAGKNAVTDLNRGHVEMIENAAQSAGVTTFMLVNTAFLEALAEIGASNDFYYTMTLGRSDTALSKYAGHHTLHPLMRYRRDPAWSLADAARYASQELVETLQYVSSPCSRREGSWDQMLFAEGAYPRQIATGLDAPSGMIQRSPFANFFSMGAGTSFRIAMFELQRIKVPSEAGDIDEIGFRPTLNSEDGELSFNFDAAAFSETEMTDIVEATVSRLGVTSAKPHWVT